MSLLRLPSLRRPIAAALLLAAVWPSFSLLAGSKPNNLLEPMTVADPSESIAPAVSVAPATSAPVAAAVVSYSGEIRRTPAGGGATVSGYFRLSISPLGKVTGSIIWSDPTEVVKITGKQDLNTRQGDFVVKDASGARVPGAPRLPFHLSQKNRLVGRGIMAGGDPASFRLNREATYPGSGGGAGGATLSLGGATVLTGTNTYNGSGATALHLGSGTLGATPNTPTLGSGTPATSFGFAGSGTFGSVSGGTLNLASTGALNLAGGSTVTITSGVGGYPPALNADGNLLLGNTLLLLGPVTTTTGPDGTITYTGKYSSGAAGTVVVRGAATGG